MLYLNHGRRGAFFTAKINFAENSGGAFLLGHPVVCIPFASHSLTVVCYFPLLPRSGRRRGGFTETGKDAHEKTAENAALGNWKIKGEKELINKIHIQCGPKVTHTHTPDFILSSWSSSIRLSSFSSCSISSWTSSINTSKEMSREPRNRVTRKYSVGGTYRVSIKHEIVPLILHLN